MKLLVKGTMAMTGTTAETTVTMMMAATELVVHPSARHQRRRGFQETASQLNGRKLLDSIRGKKTDEHVYVAPVCATHTFEKPLLDTHVYDMNSSHYMASE